MTSEGGKTTLSLEAPAPRPGSDALDGETDPAALAHMGLAFTPGYNAYDLAKEYASKYSAEEQQGLKIQFHCGTTCFNYVNSERYL